MTPALSPFRTCGTCARLIVNDDSTLRCGMYGMSKVVADPPCDAWQREVGSDDEPAIR